VTILAFLAKAAPSSSVEPGTLAFLVVFGMAVILYFLFRSMSKHLRKVSGGGRGDTTAATADRHADAAGSPSPSPGDPAAAPDSQPPSYWTGGPEGSG
jgi:hypothetical protein